MDLLIMAGGMGSRFGGLKQITPMGPNDEFLIDYSIYDAKNYGITRVIFVIKEENYTLFKETIGKRVEKIIPVEYVFQKMEDIPEYVKIPETRVKPWGTAHAIYSAKDIISSAFIVINADDFYGAEAYKVATDFIKKKKEREYATIAYKVVNTMTENGAVKRGVIEKKEGILTSIKECSIKKEKGKIVATPLDKKEPFTITLEQDVSMNMLIFDPSIFPYIKEKMECFFRENKDNLEECEFLIPDVLNYSVKEQYANVYAIETDSIWYGVTYLSDLEEVKKSLKKLVEEKKYPENLWR